MRMNSYLDLLDLILGGAIGMRVMSRKLPAFRAMKAMPKSLEIEIFKFGKASTSQRESREARGVHISASRGGAQRTGRTPESGGF